MSTALRTLAGMADGSTLATAATAGADAIDHIPELDAEIARLRAELAAALPAVTVRGVNRNRTAQLGRTPDHRNYYGEGQLPAAFDPAKLGGFPEEASISWKLPPAEIIAGRHDDRILSWHRSAADRLPKLRPGRKHRTICWHEPAREIRTGVFTAEQHAAANIRVAGLLAGGLDEVFDLALNYTISPVRATFDPAWVPFADQFPAGMVPVFTGDIYGNPVPVGGKKGLDTPYPSPTEKLDLMWDVAVDLGYTRVGVLEFNTPKRNHDDAQHSGRRAYLDAFVDHALNECPASLQMVVLDLWEGIGEWDQTFGCPEMLEWARRFVAASPVMVA